MVCRGVVKNGRVEIEPGVTLPEGTAVQVELLDGVRSKPPTSTIGGFPTDATGRTEADAAHKARRDEWWRRWDELSQEIDRAWKSPKSALEVLSEDRR